MSLPLLDQPIARTMRAGRNEFQISNVEFFKFRTAKHEFYLAYTSFMLQATLHVQYDACALRCTLRRRSEFAALLPSLNYLKILRVFSVFYGEL